MLATGGDVVAGRKFLDDLDIGDGAGTGEDALEEVVAQERVLGHPPRKGGLERVDVVDALAGIRPLAEEILVEIGAGRSVGVDAAGAGKDPLEERALAAHRQGRG